MGKETVTYAYAGIAKCGCVRAATIDNPEHAKEVRRDVVAMLKWGTIERMSLDQVRREFCIDKHGLSGEDCPHPGACPYRQKEAPDA